MQKVENNDKPKSGIIEGPTCNFFHPLSYLVLI